MKLEEVLPAYRAGRKIRYIDGDLKKSTDRYVLDQTKAEYIPISWIYGEWEIVPQLVSFQQAMEHLVKGGVARQAAWIARAADGIRFDGSGEIQFVNPDLGKQNYYLHKLDILAQWELL